MAKLSGVTVGAVGGVVLAALPVIAAHMAVDKANAAVRCPNGAQPATPIVSGYSASVRSCRWVDDASALGATLHVYRTPASSADLAHKDALRVVGAASGVPVSDNAIETDTNVATSFTTQAATRDGAAVPLIADLYLLSAGRRFGLLSVVHTADAPFARNESLVPWMETIEGTAPWGATVEGELRAQCPAGFTSLPLREPRAVVRCLYGAATHRFTVISLSWDEGGFGSETDRDRVVSAVSARAAASQGPSARMLVSPTPFTQARNVDAIYVRFDSGVTTPVTKRVVVLASAAQPQLFGVLVGEADDGSLALAQGVLSDAGATKPPSKLFIFLRPMVFSPMCSVIALLGLGLGMMVDRRRAAQAK